jgi:4-hydroxy-3-methylbut-2-enyl diphosphate reductase
MYIKLANPRGFCAGVDRAIEIVERSLDLFGAPVYVRHEVVHNKYVVDTLREKGAVFVEELDEVPDDSTVIFSAHGVAKAVREEAARRGLRVFDAICPLVTKVHMEVGRYQDEGRECILIGHAGHPEVEGTLGQYRSRNGEGGMYLVESVNDVWNLKVKNPDFLAFVTQTTLSMDDTAEVIDALRERFPKIVGPKKEDICYATQNRQDAVKKMTKECDLILVVGSQNSSNSTRLMEISQKKGVPAYLIDNASEIQEEWLQGKQNIGITAGASAPEVLVEEVIKKIKCWVADAEVLETPGIREKVVFSLPRELDHEPGHESATA